MLELLRNNEIIGMKLRHVGRRTREFNQPKHPLSWKWEQQDDTMQNLFDDDVGMDGMDGDDEVGMFLEDGRYM